MRGSRVAVRSGHAERYAWHQEPEHCPQLTRACAPDFDFFPGMTDLLFRSTETTDWALPVNRGTKRSRIYCEIELATDEKTLLAFAPIRRMVPTTITNTTASITAYSATSCPLSSDHSW